MLAILQLHSHADEIVEIDLPFAKRGQLLERGEQIPAAQQLGRIPVGDVVELDDQATLEWLGRVDAKGGWNAARLDRRVSATVADQHAATGCEHEVGSVREWLDDHLATDSLRIADHSYDRKCGCRHATPRCAPPKARSRQPGALALLLRCAQAAALPPPGARFRGAARAACEARPHDEAASERYRSAVRRRSASSLRAPRRS